MHLHGLRQEARSWFEVLVATLTYNGFKQCKSDSSVPRLRNSKTGEIKLFPAVHVDDMVVARNNKDCE